MTAPLPTKTPRLRIPPALWMTSMATVFVLIAGIALTTSIAARYGQALSELAGLSSPSSPLRGDGRSPSERRSAR